MIAARPVLALGRPLVLLVPVRLERPVRWGRIVADPVVNEAARLAVRSCCTTDYWRVEVRSAGVLYWRNEPTYSCAIRLVHQVEQSGRVRADRWHSLRRVPLLWRGE